MATNPQPPYTGSSDANLGHALHKALEDAQNRDPDYRVDKEYKIEGIWLTAGNPHIKQFNVHITF